MRQQELVGREGVIAQVEARARPGWVVTLVGPAGCGKSAIAAAWAARHGAGWVDAGDGPGALDEVEGAVVVDGIFGDRQAWSRALDERAEAVVVTSRRRLEGAREQVVRVGALGMDAALELWGVWARRRGSPEPGEGERELIARLGGNPLFMRFAFAQTMWLGATRLCAQLDRRMAWLRDEGHDPPSARAALEQTWAQLSVGARHALAALATFDAPVEVPVAHALLGAPREIAPLDARLVELAEWSLLGVEEGRLEVGVDETTRIWVRGIAPEREARGERRAFVEALSEECARLNAEVDGAAPLGAVEVLAGRSGDLARALGWAVEVGEPGHVVTLARALCHGGVFGGASSWVDEELARCQRALAEAHADARVHLSALRARAAFARGDVRAAGRALGEVRGALERAGAPARFEYMRMENGWARATGDLEWALECADELLELARRGEDLGAQAAAHLARGVTLSRMGREEEASRVLQTSLALAHAQGSCRVGALATALIAELLLARGETPRALEWFEQALEQLEHAALPSQRARALWTLCEEVWARDDARTGEVVAELERYGARSEDQAARVASAVVRAWRAQREGDALGAAVFMRQGEALARRAGFVRWAEAFGQRVGRLEREQGARLIVHRQGDWFELAGGPRVDLTRRVAARRILARLAGAGAEALPAFELLEVGWPGERVQPEAGLERVYTTVRVLRRLGLEELLLTREGGYMLDPNAAVALAE